MVLGARDADVEPPSDFFVGQAESKEIKDFSLARGEFVGGPAFPHGGTIVPRDRAPCTSLKLRKSYDKKLTAYDSAAAQ